MAVGSHRCEAYEEHGTMLATERDQCDRAPNPKGCKGDKQFIEAKEGTNRRQTPLGRASWRQCLEGQLVLVRMEQGGVPARSRGLQRFNHLLPYRGERPSALSISSGGAALLAAYLSQELVQGKPACLPRLLWASGQRAILTSVAQARARVEMLSKHS